MKNKCSLKVKLQHPYVLGAAVNHIKNILQRVFEECGEHIRFSVDVWSNHVSLNVTIMGKNYVEITSTHEWKDCDADIVVNGEALSLLFLEMALRSRVNNWRAENMVSYEKTMTECPWSLGHLLTKTPKEDSPTVKRLKELGLAFLIEHHKEGALEQALPHIEQSIKEGYTILKKGETITEDCENLNTGNMLWRMSTHIDKPVETGIFRVLRYNINYALTGYMHDGNWKYKQLHDAVKAKIREGYRILHYGETLKATQYLLTNCYQTPQWVQLTHPFGAVVRHGIYAVKR